MVSLLGLVHGADLIGIGKICDTGEQYAEYRYDRRQRAMGGLDHWLAQGADAVADRLDPCHRRTTGGERSQQKPDADRLDPERQRRGRHDRLGVTARGNSLVHANREYQQEARDE